MMTPTSTGRRGRALMKTTATYWMSKMTLILIGLTTSQRECRQLRTVYGNLIDVDDDPNHDWQHPPEAQQRGLAMVTQVQEALAFSSQDDVVQMKIENHSQDDVVQMKIENQSVPPAESQIRIQPTPQRIIITYK